MKKDTGQAQELGIIATSKVEEIFTQAIQKLENLNKRLVALRTEIKDSQKGQSPQIILGLFGCGDKCSGCPHPRWTLFMIKQNKDEKTFPKGIHLSKKESDPILSLPRKAPNYHTTANLIREAKQVMKSRQDLLQDIRNIGFRLSSTGQK